MSDRRTADMALIMESLRFLLWKAGTAKDHPKFYQAVDRRARSLIRETDREAETDASNGRRE